MQNHILMTKWQKYQFLSNGGTKSIYFRLVKKENDVVHPHMIYRQYFKSRVSKGKKLYLVQPLRKTSNAYIISRFEMPISFLKFIM